MMQELQKLYQDIPVPPNLKDDILTYCHTAQEKPKPFIVRYAKPLALAAACVAVLTVSLAATGNLFGGGGDGLPVGLPESTPEMSTPESVDSQVDEIPESASTTRGTMMTTTVRGMTTTRKSGVTTTTAHLEGTGGDEGSCQKHVMFYHNFDGRLIDYVGSDKVEAYVKENGWYNTYYLTREEREEFNIVNFVNHFGITKEAFIAAMEWTDILDQKPETGGFFGDCLYTYREYVDALYSGDQALVDEVFRYDYVEPDYSLTAACELHDPVYHTVPAELIDYVGVDEGTRFYLENRDGTPVRFHIVSFIQHFGITKAEFIRVLGLENKLDETVSFTFGSMDITFREYVETIYSADEQRIENLFAYDPQTITTTTTLSSSASILKPINGTTSTRGANTPE